jgi:nucleoside-diphosphate-sugar epimerase
MSTTSTVFVAGATGMLGTHIVERLLDRGARVRALVRNSAAADRRAALHALAEQASSLELVAGDLLDPIDDLALAIDGAEVVVSAVQGGPDVVTDGQINLIRAAGRAGAERMIPSDFAVDLHRLDYGDNVFLDQRRKADEAFEDSGVKPVFFLNGAFPEAMVAPLLQIVDFERETFTYWGDGDQPMDFTTVPDAAAFAAAAALDPEVAGRKVCVAGDVLTMNQFHAAVESGSGRRLELQHMGTADELRAEIERLETTAESPMDYGFLQFQWAMVTGKAKLTPLDNDRYPEIRPTPVEEFVRQTQRRTAT